MQRREPSDFFPALPEGGKWLLFTVAPLRDAEGNVIGALEILQDITGRKQAEEKLQESEEKYSAFFKTSRCRYKNG
ncbi:hypothetical protein C5S30_02190 [ANME-1 cluster archaeon GoMg4]|nr:hypothetical protein [ANME-1 cluster archaeon GoMg4]